MLAIHTVVEEEHFNACFAVIGLRIWRYWAHMREP